MVPGNVEEIDREGALVGVTAGRYGDLFADDGCDFTCTPRQTLPVAGAGSSFKTSVPSLFH
jgi:hypothetical protein